MPVDVVPNRIEQSDLFGGYAPDPEEASLPLNASPDVLNLLPDVGSGALELRKGFTRMTGGRINSLSASHWIRHVNYYEVIVSGARKLYLVCVLTNGTDAAANNVQIWVYDFALDTFSRVDTAGRSWAKGNTEHWHAVVEGTYYGGTNGEVIYSWHPTDGWDADPTTPSVDTWVDAVNGGVGAGQKGRNYAFKKGARVVYSGKYYSALRGIRFKTWESGERYNKGERVSVKATTGATYWRSVVCIKSHTSDAAKKPVDGADTATYWKGVRLRNIKDEDGEVTSDWAYMPLPGKGVVGTYHGNRLWVRHDDGNNWARLQYSAPARPEKDSLIADLDFRPTDWAPVDDKNGDGGGWMTIPFANSGDAIRGLYSYGSYLIIFGRWQTFVLAGVNEQTWTLRPLGRAGVVGPQSMTEHNGLVYFLNQDGTLMATDGTSMEMAPGFEKVREFVKDRTDRQIVGTNHRWYPPVVSYGPYILIGLADPNSADDYTLAYHPDTESYWLLDLPVLDMAVGTSSARTARLFFSNAITGAANQRPCVYKYQDDPGNFVFTDDDWQAVSASASTNDITWRYRTAWFKFGAARVERRLRRIWALITGETADTAQVDTYRNYEEGTARTTATRTLVGTAQGEYVEGKVGSTTAYSVGAKVSGAANAQTALHAIGIDTENVRTRFHR